MPPLPLRNTKHVGDARIIPKLDAHLEPWTMLGYVTGRNKGRTRLGTLDKAHTGAEGVSCADTDSRNPGRQLGRGAATFIYYQQVKGLVAED